MSRMVLQVRPLILLFIVKGKIMFSAYYVHSEYKYSIDTQQRQENIEI